MSDTFAVRSASLAGLAAQTLGWRPREFWAATPAELALSLGELSEPGCAPPSRDEIERLIEQDLAKDKHHG